MAGEGRAGEGRGEERGGEGGEGRGWEGGRGAGERRAGEGRTGEGRAGEGGGGGGGGGQVRGGPSLITIVFTLNIDYSTHKRTSSITHPHAHTNTTHNYARACTHISTPIHAHP